jgi:hypothetical protein
MIERLCKKGRKEGIFRFLKFGFSEMDILKMSKNDLPIFKNRKSRVFSL